MNKIQALHWLAIEFAIHSAAASNSHNLDDYEHEKHLAHLTLSTMDRILYPRRIRI